MSHLWILSGYFMGIWYFYQWGIVLSPWGLFFQACGFMSLWGMIVYSMQSKQFDGGFHEGLNLT